MKEGCTAPTCCSVYHILGLLSDWRAAHVKEGCTAPTCCSVYPILVLSERRAAHGVVRGSKLTSIFPHARVKMEETGTGSRPRFMSDPLL